MQHEPSALDNGNILIFDNRGDNGDSRVVEFDPLTNKSEWVFTGSDERRFYTETCGTCQRLPNGNTLITESEAGRAFEVSPNKLIVWEFVSPFWGRKATSASFPLLGSRMITFRSSISLDWSFRTSPTRMQLRAISSSINRFLGFRVLKMISSTTSFSRISN